MPQQTSTVLLRGGLNMVTPPVAVPAGQATAALNYEPEVAGYRRLGGYERFDGRPSPSTATAAAQKAARRAAIQKVPGTGPVRGVWAFNGALYAFRDSEDGEGRMYKSSSAGWVAQSFGYVIPYTDGTAEFEEGQTLAGATSTATATIDRFVQRSGAFNDGDAAGYLVVSNITGTFENEIGFTDTGSATIGLPQAVALSSGGKYNFVTHNFYGAAARRRIYFANGVGTAFEFNGEWLAPIQTGTTEGSLDTIVALLNRAGGKILARNGDRIIMRGANDRPRYIGQFRNHLFLSFDAGSLVHSGIGEPLDFRAIAGAAEIAFGDRITGLLSAISTALFVFGNTRIEYIAGNDSSDFAMFPITDRAGCFDGTAQGIGESPVYLDDAGVRRMSATATFGDFRMGTLTQLIEPVFRAKRAAGVTAADSLVNRAKDQYRLFFSDRTGVVVYMGRKDPEALPFKYPFQTFCSCAGELDQNAAERYFVGAEDGYVYELDAGNSFDGQPVPAYVRLAWNAVGAPTQQKRFHKATVEIDSEDEVDIGVTFDVDYAIPGNPGGVRQDLDVPAGSQSFIPIDKYENIDWSRPMQGLVEAYIDGIGRNLAVTVISEHTEEEPHTLSSLTVHFSPRKMVK